MALRSVLAELAVKVDVTELQAADGLIDRFIGKIHTLSDLLKNMPAFPKVPGGVAPGGGSTRAPKAPGVVAPTLPDQSLDSRLQERDARVTELLGNVAAATTPKLQAMQDRLKTAATRVVDLGAKVLQNQQLQERYREAMSASAEAADKLAPKLRALQAREFELVKSGKAAAEMFERQRKKLNELADAKPGNEIANGFKKAAEEGGGLLNVVAKLRRAWGLLQFTAFFTTSAFGIKTLINEMDETSKSAAALGIEIKEFQALQKFGELGGASVEQLSKVYLQLARNVRLAATGAKVQSRAFADLGIDPSKSQRTVDLLFDTYVALGKVQDNTQRLAIAQQLLGKESVRLLPAFKEGKEGLQEQIRLLKDLAVAYDQDTATAAENFNDTLDLTVHQLKSVVFEGIAILLPYLVKTVAWFMRTTKTIKETIKESSALQAGFTMLAMMLGGLFLSKILGVQSVLGTLTSILTRLAWLAIRFVLPLLVLDEIITFLRGGDTLLGRWLDKFKPGGKNAKEWLDIMWNGLKKVQEALGLALSAWRVFIRGAFGEEVNPEDVIKAERFKALVEEIAKKAAEALGQILGRAFELLKEQGYGLGDALKLGLAVFIAAAPALSAKIGLALMQGLFTSVLPWAIRLGAMAIAWIAKGIAGSALAAFAAPLAIIVGIFAAAAGVIWLLFTERGREFMYRFGEIMYDVLAWIFKGILQVAAWIGLKIGLAIEALVNKGKEAAAGIKRWFGELIDSVTAWWDNFSWSGFLNSAVDAFKKLGGVIAAVFGKIWKVVSNPGEAISDAKKWIDDLSDEMSSIVWGSAGKGMSRLTDSQIAAINEAGNGRARVMTVNDQRSVTNSFSGATPAAAQAGVRSSVAWIDRGTSYQDSEEVP